MTPSQYFEEISPLFCTTEVPYYIIGEHMQEHVRFGLSQKPRRLLVVGMKAKQLLIATSVKMVPRTRTRSDQNLSSDRIYTSTMFSRIRRRVVRGQTPIQIKPSLVVRPRFLETALSGARSWIKRSFKTFNTSKETTERCFKPTYHNSKN